VGYAATFWKVKSWNFTWRNSRRRRGKALPDFNFFYIFIYGFSRFYLLLVPFMLMFCATGYLVQTIILVFANWHLILFWTVFVTDELQFLLINALQSLLLG